MYRAVEPPKMEDKTNQIPDYLASPNNIPRIKLAIFFFQNCWSQFLAKAN
jgi:hypothetical protein